MSCTEQATLLLDQCLSGKTVDEQIVRQLLAGHCSEFFSVVAEELSNRFDPDLTLTYAQVFSKAIATVCTQFNAGDLYGRYKRISHPRRFEGEPEGIFVLSRVTVGADVAITSVMLDGLKDRFPRTPILLVSDPKIARLYESDGRVENIPFGYPRRADPVECICRSTALREIVDRPGWIVVDPDSRLTQLGLVPVCDEQRYFFMPSRSYQHESRKCLTELTREWMSHTFAINRCHPYIAPSLNPAQLCHPAAVVSFGVGGDAAKRVSAGFEAALLSRILEHGFSVYVDGGATAEERRQADEICNQAYGKSNRLQRHDGSIAEFAALIRGSDLYIGYDSAGQHLAAACSVPLLTIFSRAPTQIFVARWSPFLNGPMEIVHGHGKSESCILQETFTAVESLIKKITKQEINSI